MIRSVFFFGRIQRMKDQKTRNFCGFLKAKRKRPRSLQGRFLLALARRFGRKKKGEMVIWNSAASIHKDYNADWKRFTRKIGNVLEVFEFFSKTNNFHDQALWKLSLIHI